MSTRAQNAALQSLSQARMARDPAAAAAALAKAGEVGWTPDFVPELVLLLGEDWHTSHEAIASALQVLKDNRALDALFYGTFARHPYLAHDENFALARKCIWALADTGTPEARLYLEAIVEQQTNPVISGHAQARLDHWEQELHRKGGYQKPSTVPATRQNEPVARGTASPQVYVGFWKRAAALVVDTIVMMAAIIPLTLVFVFLLGDKALAVVSKLDDRINEALFQTAFGLVFTMGFWMGLQATPGKIAVESVIVDAKTGRKPTFWQWVLRNVGYFISAVPCGLGYLWVAFDARKQGWHDKIAGTLVVRKVAPKRAAAMRILAGMAGFGLAFYYAHFMENRPPLTPADLTSVTGTVQRASWESRRRAPVIEIWLKDRPYPFRGLVECSSKATKIGDVVRAPSPGEQVELGVPTQDLSIPQQDETGSMYFSFVAMKVGGNEMLSLDDYNDVVKETQDLIDGIAMAWGGLSLFLIVWGLWPARTPKVPRAYEAFGDYRR